MTIAGALKWTTAEGSQAQMIKKKCKNVVSNRV